MGLRLGMAPETESNILRKELVMFDSFRFRTFRKLIGSVRFGLVRPVRFGFFFLPGILEKLRCLKQQSGKRGAEQNGSSAKTARRRNGMRPKRTGQSC